MTITEFLLARIAEDEAAVEQLTHVFHSAGTQMYVKESWIMSPLRKERFLAECAAKRAIVELHSPVKDDGWKSGAAHGNLWCGSCGSIDDSPEPFPCDTLKALAAVYASHPDYRQEWSA